MPFLYWWVSRGTAAIGLAALLALGGGCSDGGRNASGDDDDDIVGDDDDDGGVPADAGPGDDDDDEEDAGADDPMIQDPFDGALGIQLGVGCNLENASFEPLMDGDTVRFEPGLQGPISRHIEIGARLWNAELEPPAGRPDAPEAEWVASRTLTTFRVIDADDTVVAELAPFVRFFPTENVDVPYRTLVTRIMVAEELFGNVLDAPVSLEVERAEGEETLRDRVDDIDLMMTPPCTSEE